MHSKKARGGIRKSRKASHHRGTEAYEQLAIEERKEKLCQKKRIRLLRCCSTPDQISKMPRLKKTVEYIVAPRTLQVSQCCEIARNSVLFNLELVILAKNLAILPAVSDKITCVPETRVSSEIF